MEKSSYKPVPHEQKIINDLTHRFMDGEKIRLDDMVDKYFAPKSRLQYINDSTKMRTLLAKLRAILHREHNVVIAPVARGLYGIPATSEEYVYAQSLYINRIRGMVHLAIELRDFGQERALIPPSFKVDRLQLPEISLGHKKA